MPADRTLQLAGITNHPVRTIGFLELPILDTPVEFHAVKNTFPITSDGILGRPYLRQEQSQISFRHNTLVTVSNSITPFPSVDKESKEAKKTFRSEIKPFKHAFKISARMRKFISIDVQNPELTEGYLPKLNTPDGIYLGEAAVTTQDGVCRIMAINTTTDDIDLEIPPQEILPYEIYEFPGHDTSDSDCENLSADVSEKLMQSQSARAEKVMNSLHIPQLTLEEKDYVSNWVNEFPDIFHLNGEQLTCTHLIRHRIPTIDNKVIFRKTYRHPQATSDKVHVQIEKQLNSGIIQESKSLYNSPIMIILKKNGCVRLFAIDCNKFYY